MGMALGTACSSALAPLIKTPWLKVLLVKGIRIGIPRFEISLGFFELEFGLALRFTLLSALFMLAIAALMLFLRFQGEDGTS